VAHNQTKRTNEILKWSRLLTRVPQARPPARRRTGSNAPSAHVTFEPAAARGWLVSRHAHFRGAARRRRDATTPLATSRPPPSVRAHDRVHVAPRTLRSRPAACARTPATRNADDRSGQGQPSPFPCVRPAGRPTMRRVPTHVTCILLGSGLRQSCLFLRAVVSYYDGWMDGSREHLGLGRSGPAPTPLRIRSQQWMPHLCVSSATTVKRRGKGKPKQKRCHRNEGWRPTCRP
jgi:hypothetical protein